MIITDSNRVLGVGKKWKRYIGKMFTPLQLYEPDKHNQNSVEREIQNLNSGLSKIINAYETGFLTYHCESMEYLCDINNYLSRSSLSNQFPYE